MSARLEHWDIGSAGSVDRLDTWTFSPPLRMLAKNYVLASASSIAEMPSPCQGAVNFYLASPGSLVCGRLARDMPLQESRPATGEMSLLVILNKDSGGRESMSASKGGSNMSGT